MPNGSRQDELRNRGGAAVPAGGPPPASAGRPRPGLRCLPAGTRRRLLAGLAVVLALAGCAKYNTYHNAKKAFDEAEWVRDEAIRKHDDPPKPSGLQKTNYETAIQKAQKVLDEYPGHGLTDDALFLQAKAWHRLEGYRMSIRKLDLLFLNFPATDYLEESLYLQGLNYLLIGGLDKSQEFLAQLERRFPDSRYRAEVRKVSGDNAFTLEKWEEAATAYRRYLAENPDDGDRDRIGLKLAECLWELAAYPDAVDVLGEVGGNTRSAELAFRARLLLARVHVRIGDYQRAAALLGELRQEAEIYNARGDVRLIEAESLVAQDRPDEAAALLESMPVEWETPKVKVQAADLLGYMYMGRGEWEEARAAFQNALRTPTDLEEPDRTRRLHDTLKNFLAAEQALVDARGADVAQLRLGKANALLFGFDRPRAALELYAAAAADTAATPDVAARAMYGALITWRDHLDRPDSGEVYARALQERFPDSPQAYEAGRGGRSDLLGYLLDRRRQEQAARLAALTPEERLALASGEGIAVGADGGIRRPAADSGLRRRLVYLSRRPNLDFPPTPEELALAAQRAGQVRARTTRAAVADSARAAAAAAADTAAAPPPRPAGAEIGGGEPAAAPAVVAPDSLAPAGVADTPPPDGAEQTAEDEDEEKDDDKKKKKKDTFDLRSPRPAPGSAP